MLKSKWAKAALVFAISTGVMVGCGKDKKTENQNVNPYGYNPYGNYNYNSGNPYYTGNNLSEQTSSAIQNINGSFTGYYSIEGKSSGTATAQFTSTTSQSVSLTVSGGEMSFTVQLAPVMSYGGAIQLNPVSRTSFNTSHGKKVVGAVVIGTDGKPRSIGFFNDDWYNKGADYNTYIRF